MTQAPWMSAIEANKLWPDVEHFDSTLGNLAEIYRVSADLACWQIARVDALEVDPSVLHHDPDDVVGAQKIASLRAAIVAGETLPPVWLVHRPGQEYPWSMLEGMHRSSAARDEKAGLLAWVAHIACCGGPVARQT